MIKPFLLYLLKKDYARRIHFIGGWNNYSSRTDF